MYISSQNHPVAFTPIQNIQWISAKSASSPSALFSGKDQYHFSGGGNKKKRVDELAQECQALAIPGKLIIEAKKTAWDSLSSTKSENGKHNTTEKRYQAQIVALRELKKKFDISKAVPKNQRKHEYGTTTQETESSQLKQTTKGCLEDESCPFPISGAFRDYAEAQARSLGYEYGKQVPPPPLARQIAHYLTVMDHGDEGGAIFTEEEVIHHFTHIRPPTP